MSEDKISQDVIKRAKRAKLLLMDCDGVLTDGRLYFSKGGEELKVFHVHDGQGIVSWHNAGFKSGIITGRKSETLTKRCEELGIHYLIQGSRDKEKDFKKILSDSKLDSSEVVYIGDDIADVGLLKMVGLPIVVNNAVKEIQHLALYKTNKNGGLGAVRELTDLLLKIKSK